MKQLELTPFLDKHLINKASDTIPIPTIIQTYKIKHNRDFSWELGQARKIAIFACNNKLTKYNRKLLSSKTVKEHGLKSQISCQILRKYQRIKNIKNVSKVNLTISGYHVNIIKNEQDIPEKIYVPCLKLELDIYFKKNFIKINWIEFNNIYAYISVTYNCPPIYDPKEFIGIDRNTNHHSIVASFLHSGKILKLGKECYFTHKKYRDLRRNFQKKGKLKRARDIKHREGDIIKNINHHITTKLIEEAVKVKGGIVLEDLKKIRETAKKKTKKKHKYFLNSWSFYQQEQMLIYKAKKNGVPIFYIEPEYTSQRCSGCGHIEKANRRKNLFQCKQCGKVEDSGVNAGFNIAYLHTQNRDGILRFCKERDLQKGNTEIPKEALLVNQSNFRTQSL
jgi:putative transposase